MATRYRSLTDALADPRLAAHAGVAPLTRTQTAAALELAAETGLLPGTWIGDHTLEAVVGLVRSVGRPLLRRAA